MGDRPQDVSDKTIQRIAKLKRLAAGAEGSESENAMREATRLEAKYGVEVDVEDIDDYLDQGEAEKRWERRWLHACKFEERHWHDWRQFLLQTLAPLYECASLPQEDVSVDMFFLWVAGDPVQLEYCATHFEWLCYRIEVVAEECDWDHLTREEKRGVRFGAMDKLIRNMSTWDAAAAAAQRAETEVTVEASGALPGYVNPAALVPKRGLVRVGGPGDLRKDAPPPLDSKPPPVWAYKRGYRAAELEDPQPPHILLQPVTSLPGLDGSTTSILMKMGYVTVAQLVRARPKELLAHRGIGRRRLARVRAALERQGLRLMADWTRGTEAPKPKDQPASASTPDNEGRTKSEEDESAVGRLRNKMNRLRDRYGLRGRGRGGRGR